MSLAVRFREAGTARKIVKAINELGVDEEVKVCHVCGTHEWTVSHYGLRSLLPRNVEVIAGPGCPVCIVPAREIDEAVWLSMNEATVITFGDMFRAPGSRMSLRDAKAVGGRVQIVYSVREAVKVAREHPDEEYVFFAIGFETTAPTTAVEVVRGLPKNLSFLVSHRLIPPAMEALAGMEDLRISGFIAPGHVSTIIGAEPYRVFPEKYGIPVVIAGFEPLDFLMAVYMLLRQVKEGVARLENEYRRAVRWEGNVVAKRMIDRAYEVVDGGWRGIGVIPSSALKLRERYSEWDARLRYDIKVGPGVDVHPGCRCPDIMVGKAKPTDCPLFMKACTPERPKGPCMVSVEGTCRIWAVHLPETLEKTY